MVTGNEVSAHWVVVCFTGGSFCAEIRSLSPHFRVGSSQRWAGRMVTGFEVSARRVVSGIPANAAPLSQLGKMVTGNEVSARGVVVCFTGGSFCAEIRSLSPHFRVGSSQRWAGRMVTGNEVLRAVGGLGQPRERGAAQPTRKNGDRQRSFRALGGRVFHWGFILRGNSKPVTTFPSWEFVGWRNSEITAFPGHWRLRKAWPT
jgi:hypothetical protein